METKIQHLGVAVNSLDDALNFWRDALGLTLKEVEVVAEQGVRVAMLPLGEQIRSPWRVRRTLAARDYQEVVNFSFVDSAWERDFCANEAPVVLAAWPRIGLRRLRSIDAGIHGATVRPCVRPRR